MPLISELAQATVERDELFHSMQDLAVTVANLQQAKRTAELERESLLRAYDEVVEDRKAIDREADVLRAFQDGATHKIKILQEKVIELQEQVNIHVVAEQTLSHQSALTTQQHLEASERAMQERRNCEALEADNRRLLKEVDGLAQTNAVLRDRVEVLTKRAAASNEATKVSIVSE